MDRFESSERELLENTLEDLGHLAEETASEVNDHQLRRVSVTLRNLLVYDWVRKCWRLLEMSPRTPTVIAPRLRSEFVTGEFAVAGGANVGGISIANVHVYTSAPNASNEAAYFKTAKADSQYAFDLAAFTESCAIVFKGKKISRQQVILYVANKKGGTHLDPKRKKDEEAYSTLDVVATIGSFGGREGDDALEGKNPIYLELMSIGQFLVNSPDIGRLRKAIANALGRHE
jgi:hypothetical protein